MLGVKQNNKAKMLIFIAILRILASCLITNTHYNNVYPISALAIGGLLGDVLFFAISGYCLFNVRGNFFKWYGKRLVRIYLPVFLITALYLLIGFYSFKPNGFVWWFLYPTNYHFVPSILILYVPFFCLFSFEKVKDKIPIIMALVGVAYFVVYAIFYDKSYYHIDYVQEPMIWFMFFQAMLMGAYVRRGEEKYTKQFNLSSVLMTVASALLYGVCKVAVSRFSWLNNFQFVSQLSLLLLLFYLFKTVASMETIFDKMSQRVKGVLIFASKLTLEIYLVQKPLIALLEKAIFFPLNWFAITASIIASAIALHLVCDGIIKIVNYFLALIKTKLQYKEQVKRGESQ